MKHLARIRINKMIQVLAAALTIGATVLSVAPGEAEAKPIRDNGVRCTEELADGTIAFWMPGTYLSAGPRMFRCTSGGYWTQVGASEDDAPAGGRPRGGGGRGGRGK